MEAAAASGQRQRERERGGGEGERERVASGFVGMNDREVEVHFEAKPSGCPADATAQLKWQIRESQMRRERVRGGGDDDGSRREDVTVGGGCRCACASCMPVIRIDK